MNKPLSSFDLKLVAVALMVIDHVGFVFFPELGILRVVGRLAFPLFAFGVAEGFSKTSDLVGYSARLLFFALISQLPYIWLYEAAGASAGLNIFFTLFSGVLALFILKNFSFLSSIFLIFLLLFLAETHNFDYGSYGVLTILVLSFFSRKSHLVSIAFTILTVVYSFRFYSGNNFPIQQYSLLVLPLLYLYGGERGFRLPRYALYIFYPAHLCLIYFIYRLIN